MITVIYLGRHEIRLAESTVIYVAFHGDVDPEAASEISHLINEHLRGRSGHVLVNVTDLGRVAPASQREFSLMRPWPGRRELQTLDIVFIGARLMQKVLMSQIITLASSDPGTQLQVHFFEVREDALSWVGIAEAALFASDGLIYLTR